MRYLYIIGVPIALGAVMMMVGAIIDKKYPVIIKINDLIISHYPRYRKYLPHVVFFPIVVIFRTYDADDTHLAFLAYVAGSIALSFRIQDESQYEYRKWIYESWLYFPMASAFYGLSLVFLSAVAFWIFVVIAGLFVMLVNAF